MEGAFKNKKEITDIKFIETDWLLTRMSVLSLVTNYFSTSYFENESGSMVFSSGVLPEAVISRRYNDFKIT